MKTIKTKVVAIMLVLALALTGCVTQKSTVVINSDGSAKMTTNIKIDKQAAIQAYIKMMKAQGQTVSEAEVTALITLMLPKLKDEGIDVKTVTENGKDYYVIDYSQNIKKGDLQKEFGVEGFDKSLAEGTMLLTPYASDAQDEKTQTFTKAYEDKYGNTPIQFAADAYDAIYAIKAAAEEADVTPDMDYSEMCDKLMDAMTKVKIDGLTGVDGITWEKNGEPNKAPKGVKIENGAYVSMD